MPERFAASKFVVVPSLWPDNRRAAPTRQLPIRTPLKQRRTRLQSCFSLSAKPVCAILISMFRTQDLHVKGIVRLLTPRELKAQTPAPDAVH
jgi:hypothetical protein